MSTVVIDPGRGTIGPGGVREERFTRELAEQVAAGLAAHRVQAEVTRPGARARLGRGKDVFVAIDFNGYPDPRVQGTETWIHPFSTLRSRDLAVRLQGAVRRVTGHPDRGVRAQPLAVLAPFNGTPTAAAQIEVSFLSSPQEVLRLSDPAYRYNLAEALVRALLGYLRSSYHGHGGYPGVREA